MVQEGESSGWLFLDSHWTRWTPTGLYAFREWAMTQTEAVVAEAKSWERKVSRCELISDEDAICHDSIHDLNTLWTHKTKLET
jgi:hypothetical protein